MIIKMNSVDCLIGLVLFYCYIWLVLVCDVLKRRGKSSVMEGITVMFLALLCHCFNQTIYGSLFTVLGWATASVSLHT